MDWFRWYHGSATDLKWRTIAEKTGIPISEVVTIWAMLLENASQSATRGTIEGWYPEDIATALSTKKHNVTRETVETVWNEMQQKTLEGNKIKRFTKRNPLRERVDLSTDRVRAFRAKKHQVTPGNTEKHLDKIRLEEKIEEGNKGKTTNSATDGSPPPEPDPPAADVHVDFIPGTAEFDQVWTRYPNRVGRKEAERHFKASVKTEDKLSEIALALENYKNHLKVNDWKRPMNGSTWFNNWGDWTNWVEPVVPVNGNGNGTRQQNIGFDSKGAGSEVEKRGSYPAYKPKQ